MGSQLRHRGQRAVQHLLEHAPHGGALALWARHADRPAGDPDERAPVWTDGRCLFYGPAFESLRLEQQAGWVAHVILHVALRHAQRALAMQLRRGSLDLALWNRCADAIVNSALAHLGWLALPAGGLRLETVLERVLGRDLEPQAALQQWDVERLYLAVVDTPPSESTPARVSSRSARGARHASGHDAHDGGRPRPAATGGSQPSGRAEGTRADRLRALAGGQPLDLVPSPSADGDDAPEQEAERAREWGERLLRAHAGDGTFSLLRTLLADLPRTHTPWEQVLRCRLARALSLRPGLSWSRPARGWLANRGRVGAHGRLPWEPGRSAACAVPRVVLVIDVSGSIDGALLARFGRELAALLRRLEAALVLVVGDDRVRDVRRFEPGGLAFDGRLDANALRFEGGGGTDFTPLLAEAVRHRPDLVVVLTDLDGPARERPACPVLWAVPPEHAGASVPFGQRLVLR